MLILITLITPTSALAQSPTCEFEYTVQAGDWLSKIAEKYYGDALAFPRIVEASNVQSNDAYADIANPDLIEPGLVLCLPPADVMAQLLQVAQSAPPGLSPSELAKATYPSQYYPSGAVTLENGRFSEPVAPGSATEIKVQLTRHLAYGQVNGQPAAAIVLVSDPGGSGTFYDLHVMVSQDGRPVSVASTLLGDRVQINSIAIENNQIKVDMVQAGPDDPLCCPSQRVIKTFEVQGEQLVEVSSQIVEDTSSSPPLMGTVWQWDQTLMNNDDTFKPNNPDSYTLQFKPDGTVAIQADCNQVGGTYTLDGSRITIELGPSTMAACPEGSLADQFLTQLGGAVIYFIEGQKLFLDLQFDSGTMHFSPQSTDLVGTNWIVTGYNNGQEAVVSPIVSTEITAFFGPGNNLTGSSGCNTYSGGYEFGPDQTVTIRNLSQPTTNLQTCTEPAGIMEQEQAYLAALSNAATYELQGDVLSFRNAENATAVTYLLVPQEAPPAQDSGSVLDTMAHTPDPNLVNKTWAWERRDPNRNPSEEILVPNPENYTLTFAEDGTFTALLDCNNANGRYATTPLSETSNSIFMELGPTQMAFCGEDSLDTAMVNMFGPAQNYRYEEDGAVVVFIWVAGGPIDYFRVR
jgi:heat shock protein HslJ